MTNLYNRKFTTLIYLYIDIYSAIFPRLARALPTERENRDKLRQGEITFEEFEKRSSMNRNMVSSISTAHSNWVGYREPLSLCWRYALTSITFLMTIS